MKTTAAHSIRCALAVLFVALIACAADIAAAAELQTLEIASKTGVHAFQAEMAISRPTAADPEFPHNGKPVRIGQREVLVGEFLHDASCLGQLGSVEASDSQAGWTSMKARN